jgi:ketosteroid isomerase-like protein
MVLLSAAAMSLTLGGCGKSTAGKAGSADSAKQAINADAAKWNKDFKAKDTEALSGHYADDAFLVAPGVTGADGSTAIRQVYATASTDPAFEVHFTVDKTDGASGGDMAYARGKFTEKYTDKKTGKVMTTSGSYLSVYKKQDDGGLKVVESFVDADPDATKPVPPEKPATRAKMTSF